MGTLDPTAVAAGFATITTASAAFPILAAVVGTGFALWVLFLGARKLISTFRGR